MIHIRAAGRTHIGQVRRHNEDALYVGRNLFAVADGLGGHVAGDVASSTVIDAFRLHDQQASPTELPDAIGRAVSEANTALRQRIAEDPQVEGMGSTLVALLISGGKAVIANVGDSRLYWTPASRNETVQLTEDHVYARLMAGADRVPHLPERLSRFLDGRPAGRSPDITPLTLTPGDRILLCSDGLSSYVPHDLIHQALADEGTPEEAAQHLELLALQHGGPDNVTTIVIDVTDRDVDVEHTPRGRQGTGRPSACR